MQLDLIHLKRQKVYSLVFCKKLKTNFAKVEYQIKHSLLIWQKNGLKSDFGDERKNIVRSKKNPGIKSSVFKNAEQSKIPEL